ncbi:MAG: hypothetical protein HYU63_07570 [Armatimonadetes bacterium]|nr:hypothetical protein [Armatimonadota bacterium]
MTQSIKNNALASANHNTAIKSAAKGQNTPLLNLTLTPANLEKIRKYLFANNPAPQPEKPDWMKPKPDWKPENVAGQITNPDGTVTNIYKNGLKERLDPKTSQGAIILPNEVKIEILETDENGAPTKLRANYQGKFIPVEFKKDFLQEEYIILENYDGKGAKIEIRERSGARNYHLSDDDKKDPNLAKKAWAEYSFYNNLHQTCKSNGKLEFRWGNLLGRYLDDETLRPDGKLILYNFPDVSKDTDKALLNKDGSYEVSWVNKKSLWRENPADHTYKEVIEEEKEVSCIKPFITHDQIKKAIESE